MKPTRILLVDDSALFLDSADLFLSAIPSIVVVGRAMSGEDALRCVSALRPDVVLMDLDMPGMSGLEATRQIKALPQPPRVVIVTVHNHAAYRTAAQAAGADGFLSKSEFGKQLLPLIQTLCAESAAHERDKEDNSDEN